MKRQNLNKFLGSNSSFDMVGFLRVFLIMFFCQVGYSQKYIDLDTVAKRRSQDYCLRNYRKIIVCTPYRTGSTLIYNVLRFFFDNAVIKTHTIPHIQEETFFVFTIRSPLQCCCSRCRIEWKDNLDAIASNVSKLDKIVQEYIQQIGNIRKFLQENHPAVLLKYEDFDDNLEYILRKIEVCFKIRIHPADRALLKKAFSKENVNNHIKKYENFSQYDKITHWHGNHLSLTEDYSSDAWKKIREEIKSRLIYHKFLINDFGYTLD